MAATAGVLIKHLGVDFASVDSVQKHALGIELDCDDGTRRKYVRAGAAVAQYDALIVDFAEGPYDYQPSAAALDILAGICPVAGVSDNYFFWAIIRGKATVKVPAAGVTAGLHLVTLATAGTLDDTAASAANALAGAMGVGCLCVADNVPADGFATVVLF